MATSLASSTRPATEAAVGQRQLVDALRAGDQRAFHSLVESHYPMMKRVARSYVDSDALAEEVVQETWLAVVRGIGRFQHRSALSTWIYSILANKARTHGSRERRMLPFSSVGGPAENGASVDGDRFQSDEDAWPGHWATPPRPWQKPERRLRSPPARGPLTHLDQMNATLAALRRLPPEPVPGELHRAIASALGASGYSTGRRNHPIARPRRLGPDSSS